MLVQKQVFPNAVRPLSYGFRTFVHYPKQILRSVETTKHTWPLEQDIDTYGMEFEINSMTEFQLKYGKLPDIDEYQFVKPIPIKDGSPNRINRRKK